ncbi:TIGR03960 family B12-binding radical SAM protein [Pseudobacteroides cellulosolvens]|uniref:TIGR03960 family B12-binding radical SAM protein n=1 Tax=Pseudobacteroides cellulosolvens TaxID=35825 RepID=UPI000565700E|nr:TIGR03960 family B12-binding radical SAM protein [Pseudobacteroides cellulosolvens]
MINKISDEILLSVEKPSRYTGNEWNSIKKDISNIKIRFAFCFPDVYEVGMSHLGMKILYHLINKRDDAYCERVFVPWVDMEAKMREKSIPLFALETKSPVKDFDILGFTLQYEMCYTNILNALDLSGIPVLSSERTNKHPFVCAGGPCAYNPEPLAEFIDFFVLGEGEEVLHDVLDAYSLWKDQNASRQEYLEKISKIEGVYVPSFYDVKYKEDGTIEKFIPKKKDYPEVIKKRIIKDLDNTFFPEEIIVPFTDIVHDRVMLELFRGCIRGCRFCQAGFIYRPVRERSTEKLSETAKKLIDSSGYDEISLTSLSTSDYTNLPDLTGKLIEEMEKRKVNLSLPSLRIDSFSLDLMEKAQKVRKSGLTFAPEAGTQRLRDVINKGVTEEDLIKSATLAFSGGWNGVKLYFMIGLPTETMEDVEGIADLGNKVVDAYMSVPKEKRGKGLNVTISTSSFVPKPFTPFQWEPQDFIETFTEKQKTLKSKIKNKYISYNWHDSKLSLLEAVFARGDRRLCKVLLRAWEKGCKFDAWGEHFKYDAWMEAFLENGVDVHFYANRKRSYDEILPWDHIDIGVSKDFFINEMEKAKAEELTSNCRTGCSGCGAAVFEGGVCIE